MIWTSVSVSRAWIKSVIYYLLKGGLLLRIWKILLATTQHRGLNLMALRLPKPDKPVSDYARKSYTLQCGSKIYESGVHRDSWIVWMRHKGWVQSESGKAVHAGRFLFDEGGLKYFDTPEAALVALESAKRDEPRR